MSSTFIALPLTSGEAFLLRTTDDYSREWVILVDGGTKYSKRSRELAKVLALVCPKIERIDIAVCTHSDADHAQGFWHFADDWYDMCCTIGEFWLPGRWANAMPEILTDPAGFAAKLLQGAFESSSRSISARETDGAGRGPELNEQLKQAFKKSDVDSSSVALMNSNSREPEDPVAASFGLTNDEAAGLCADLEEADNNVDPFEQAVAWFKFGGLGVHRSWPDEFYRRPWSHLIEVTAKTQVAFAEVAQTALAIRKIAVAALTRRIRLRWFDFGEYMNSGIASGGNLGLLEPFCAVEVMPNPKETTSALALFHYLRLSRQNVESLVFYRPETVNEPGALFLGDSRLAHGIMAPSKDFPVPKGFAKPKNKLLVTAPHHGSSHNDHAFSVLGNWVGAGGAHFVRNGGQSNQSLGVFANQAERRCAQCVQCHGKAWNQWVCISSTGNSWSWPPRANSCGIPKI